MGRGAVWCEAGYQRVEGIPAHWHERIYSMTLRECPNPGCTRERVLVWWDGKDQVWRIQGHQLRKWKEA